jgi:hypothetical protein
MKEDRNYIKYRKFVLDKFRQYLSGEIDNHTLNQDLHTIQNELGFNRQRGIKCVWLENIKYKKEFSFTINQLWSDLKFGSTLTQERVKELMQLSIDNPKDFKIYYS